MAAAEAVDAMGQEFLAGAGFASNENGGVGIGHLLDLGENLFHGPAAGDNAFMAVLDHNLVAQVNVFLLQLLL